MGQCSQPRVLNEQTWLCIPAECLNYQEEFSTPLLWMCLKVLLLTFFPGLSFVIQKVTLAPQRRHRAHSLAPSKFLIHISHYHLYFYHHHRSKCVAVRDFKCPALKNSCHPMTSFFQDVKSKPPYKSKSYLITIPHQLDEMTLSLSLNTTGAKQLKMQKENKHQLRAPTQQNENVGEGAVCVSLYLKSLIVIPIPCSYLCHMGGAQSQKSFLEKGRKLVVCLVLSQEPFAFLVAGRIPFCSLISSKQTYILIVNQSSDFFPSGS